MTVESDSVLWIASEGLGAVRFNLADASWKPYFTDLNGAWYAYFSMTLVSKDEGPAVFGGRLSTKYGLFEVDTVTNLIKPISWIDSMDYKVDNVLGAVKTGSDKWWLVTTDGLLTTNEGDSLARRVSKSETYQAVMALYTGDVQKIINLADGVGIGVVPKISAKQDAVRFDGTQLSFDLPYSGTIALVDYKGRELSSIQVDQLTNFALPKNLGAGQFIVLLKGVQGTQAIAIRSVQ